MKTFVTIVVVLLIVYPPLGLWVACVGAGAWALDKLWNTPPDIRY